MDKKDVDKFEKLSGQLKSAYEEVSLLSKKNPNDAVNKFKLNYLNILVKECNTYLEQEYKPFSDFECFDEEIVPQTSDVVFILSQYIECFEKYRSDNVFSQLGDWYWKVNGNEKISTFRPKRLKE